MPYFSIIIPTYNRGNVIRRSIDSIIAQTFIDWELIIVDDGSTDDTKEIVLSYNSEKIRYVWQENQERSAARNHGIELAKGNWICFQDSDDEYLPEHLDVLNQGILDYPDKVVFRTGLLIFEGSKMVKKSNFEPNNIYDQFPFSCIQVYTFQQRILESIKFDPNIFIGEDLRFLLKIGQKNEIKVLENWTGKYYYDPSSSGGVGLNYEKNLCNKIKNLDDILSWKNNDKIQPFLIRSRCLAEFLLLGNHCIYQKTKVGKSIVSNLKCFFRFPREYLLLIIRIIYVKFGEITGLYYNDYRF